MCIAVWLTSLEDSHDVYVLILELKVADNGAILFVCFLIARELVRMLNGTKVRKNDLQ